MKLTADFYRRPDVLDVARALLGKVLCTSLDNDLTSAVITETEAYAGVDDKASHAYGNRRTPRTEPMYGPGGLAYIYLCYGIHHLFNVVTNDTGIPHAVLVRAADPLDGADIQRARRGVNDTARKLMPGPGTVAQALGITTSLSGIDLGGDTVWIEDRDIDVPDRHVTVGPRIGVDYAGDDARRPYRFIAALDAH